MYNYVITSDDVEASNDKIEEIKKSFNYEDFDESSYDLEDDGIYSLIDEISTISLFDNRKFIVIKKAEKIAGVSDGAFNELLKYMNDTNSENVLIFTFYSTFDYNNSNYQKLRKYTSNIDIKLKNMPFDEYIDKLLNDNGYKINDDAKTLLISYTENLAGLKEHLNQLMCYKMTEKIINSKDVKLLVNQPLDNNVYALVEAVVSRDKKRIFSCYQDLKLENIQASYLVSLLINKFQEMYNVSVLIKAGMGQNDIASLFNVSSGRAYYMVKNAKGTLQSVIKRNLDLLNDLDFNIKTGKVDQNLGIELYFLN